MSHFRTLPTWLKMATIVVFAAIATRAVVALMGDLEAITLLRNFVFWAVVLTPVAIVVDMTIRSIMNYRFVRLTVARVQTNRARRR